jgi:lipopolysaccharide/colanic/teichoic acid biosynthesis glycosyltransferase
MGLVALAIKLDSKGPVLFRQKRFGFNNERIDVFKFRSLYHEHADPRPRKVVTKNDSRVTRVGRFIRKTSLDELPHCSMSSSRATCRWSGRARTRCKGKVAEPVVRRRPSTAISRDHRVKPDHRLGADQRLARRRSTPTRKSRSASSSTSITIENWSVLLDLYILFKTPLALMTKNENAY